MTSPNRTPIRRGLSSSLRDWLAQRASSAAFSVYMVILLIQVAMVEHLDYASWAAIFASLPMKLSTFAVFCGIFYHAWVGLRLVLTDYVKPVLLCLSLQAAVILLLLSCTGYTIQILGRI